MIYRAVAVDWSLATSPLVVVILLNYYGGLLFRVYCILLRWHILIIVGSLCSYKLRLRLINNIFAYLCGKKLFTPIRSVFPFNWNVFCVNNKPPRIISAQMVCLINNFQKIRKTTCYDIKEFAIVFGLLSNVT